MKFVCQICGYIYDEAKENLAFDQLPDSWICPLCKVAKSAFAAEGKEENDRKEGEKEPVQQEEILTDPEYQELSFGELSILCSNLAKGCEKQYQFEEKEQFLKLSEYFYRLEPKPERADRKALAELVTKNLEEQYPRLSEAAREQADRGTLRICTWGEKVTRIADMLIKRYEKEGDAFLRGTNVWVCTICGFIYIGKEAPELCPVCKVPDWKFEKIEGRASR